MIAEVSSNPTWFNTFIDATCNKKITWQKNARLKIFRKISHLTPKKNVENIICKKQQLDKQLVEIAIVSMVKEIVFEDLICKVGVRYNNGNLFFWIEAKSSVDDSVTKINQLIDLKNNCYNTVGLKIHSIVIEDNLNFDIPSDYKTIKLPN